MGRNLRYLFLGGVRSPYGILFVFFLKKVISKVPVFGMVVTPLKKHVYFEGQFKVLTWVQSLYEIGS